MSRTRLPEQPVTARGLPARPVSQPRAIARWLFAVAALVFVMVVVGGITRLTESGLSITEWRPVTGAIPPLSEAAWMREFDLYRRTTEYQTVNQGMSLDAFKTIYFWEYLHRLIGRVIGLAFALPALWFWWRRAIPAGYGIRLVALFGLGALQGVIGWWMVTSGLFGATSVSHHRLAIHLVLAFVIFAGLLWTAFDLRGDPARPARLRTVAAVVLLVLFVQMTLGAFVAGLDAGYAFSSWPLMGDSLYPANAPVLEPAWRNLVDNPITVQFAHRWWAFVAAAALAVLAMKAARLGGRREAWAVTLLLAVQILLGIMTLLTGMHLHVAVSHQAVGLLLLGAATAAAHRVGRPQRG